MKERGYSLKRERENTACQILKPYTWRINKKAFLEGLNVDGWDNDKFFKQYVEDEELIDFETGKRKLIMSNRAELEDERAKEVARLVAEKINCLFARFKELGLQIKKKRKECSSLPRGRFLPTLLPRRVRRGGVLYLNKAQYLDQ